MSTIDRMKIMKLKIMGKLYIINYIIIISITINCNNNNKLHND
jgi:hypothetical protein